jgi:hypothetical protein
MVGRDNTHEEAGDQGAQTPRRRRLAIVDVFVVFVVHGTVPEQQTVEEGLNGGG